MITPQHYNETAFSPFMLNFVPLEVDGFFLGHVSQTLKTGYLAGIEAYNDYPIENESDALLTPQEYTMLASKSYQGNGDFATFSRGFITGFVACALGLVK